MPKPILNLFTGQAKTVTYNYFEPPGAPNPPTPAAFTTTDTTGSVVASTTINENLNGTTATQAVTITAGSTAGTYVVSSTINGVDQGDAGGATVIVTIPPPDTGAFDTSTFS
jgi:hypothetical protein